MDNLLKQVTIKEIEDAFLKERSTYFLNIIRLANENKVLSKAFLELYFIKSLDYCLKNGVDVLPKYIDIFGLTTLRAGKLIQDYVSLELTIHSKMSSHTFLIVNNAIESSINDGIIFEESFLLLKIVLENMSPEKNNELIIRNRSNLAVFTQNKLNIELNNKSRHKEVSKL